MTLLENDKARASKYSSQFYIHHKTFRFSAKDDNLKAGEERIQRSAGRGYSREVELNILDKCNFTQFSIY